MLLDNKSNGLGYHKKQEKGNVRRVKAGIKNKIQDVDINAKEVA